MTTMMPNIGSDELASGVTIATDAERVFPGSRQLRFFPTAEQLSKCLGTSLSSNNRNLRLEIGLPLLRVIASVSVRAVQFDSDYYRLAYPDIAILYAAGEIEDFFVHFVEVGCFDGRLPCESNFEELFYLERYPDIREAVLRGQFRTGFEHYINCGRDEGRLPTQYSQTIDRVYKCFNSLLSTNRQDQTVVVDLSLLRSTISEAIRTMPFDPVYYQSTYPDVAKLRVSGKIRNLNDHFAEFGFFEGRVPCWPEFDAEFYLGHYPDIREAVLRREFCTGFEHYINHGRCEGRIPTRSLQHEIEYWKSVLDAENARRLG
jgi:hypothetical protein